MKTQRRPNRKVLYIDKSEFDIVHRIAERFDVPLMTAAKWIMSSVNPETFKPKPKKEDEKE